MTDKALRSSTLSIVALLVAVFGVLAGNGILTVLLPVRAELEGFPALDIGLMGSAYFFGMLAGATLTPWLVARLGHIKAFGISSADRGAGDPRARARSSSRSPGSCIRGLCGFFLAGIYAIVESYLQGKAENRIRGRLLGIYSVAQYSGWAAGAQMMRLGEPMAFTLFGIAAAVIVVSSSCRSFLIEDDAPRARHERRARMHLVWLYRTSPVGFVCAILIGFANGPFWSLTPVYATAMGMSAVVTATLMTAITIGAAAFQFPVGRLSDAARPAPCAGRPRQPRPRCSRSRCSCTAPACAGRLAADRRSAVDHGRHHRHAILYRLGPYQRPHRAGERGRRRGGAAVSLLQRRDHRPDHGLA